MHREITPSERLGHSDTPLSLYLLTALLALLVGADVWPALVEWAGWSGSWVPSWPREVFTFRIALVAAVIGGARVLYGSLESLFEGKLGADLALAIACIAAILIGEPLVAAEVVFIGLLGEVLENWTFRRSQKAIQGLLEITPQRCWRLRDGREERILVSDLQVGDVVVVKPGARVPADGIVREGRSTLDTSALTGESLPREAGPGDEVLAGSLNGAGALTIEATRVAEQTVVGRVLTMTVDALRNKGKGERTADRMARYFLPVVLGLAALTFLVALVANGMSVRSTTGVKPGLPDLIRLAAYPALSVLVVACPCALILATPAAILAALGRLARTGILIKSGSALERLAEVDAFAFDKTGTLTEGRLELGDVVPLAGVSPGEVVRAAATAEQRSEHPLARLILAEAERSGLAPEPVDDFIAHPGGGVSARTAAGTFVVGTLRLLRDQGIAVPDDALAVLDDLDARGQTSLLVAFEGRVLGVIGARDRVRPEAADVLTELRSLGIGRVSLLTGDRRGAAEAVAERVGIEDVHPELLPQDKATFVSSPSPARIAFVGDGINDAPALAAAHVGLAIGSGTDVAAEAGDVIFMGEPLRHLPLLVRLSRRTVEVIRQNIILFAFAVNIVGVVLTAWLWPLLAPAGWWYEQSPLIAVLYHQVGSLLVLLNSLRLLWFEQERGPRTQRWQRRMEGLNAWMERNLDVDRWLHSLGHHWRIIAGGAGVMALAIYFLTGLTQVNADEVGVVRRFGRVVESNLEQGLHWRWPWPIETVTRIQPERVRSVEVGFRSVKGKVGDGRSWASPHGVEVTRYEDEAVMITGDDSLVEVFATLHYTIADVSVYLFETTDVEAALRDATEAALRELVISRTFTSLLTSERRSLEETALGRLRERCRPLGVHLVSLTLQEMHPPVEVVPSFHEVANAMEKEQELINRARADETDRLAKAEAAVKRKDTLGAAERKSVVEQAKASREVFDERSQARGQLTINQDLRLILRTLGQLKPETKQEELNALYLKLKREELARQRQWSDERLRREVLAKTLRDRELVLIDAPPALASLLYALDQLRETLGPLLQARPRPPPNDGP